MCKARNRVRKCNERRTNIFIGVSTTLGAVASVLHLRNPHSIICDVTHRRLCATTIFIQRLYNVRDVYLFWKWRKVNLVMKFPSAFSFIITWVWRCMKVASLRKKGRWVTLMRTIWNVIRRSGHTESDSLASKCVSNFCVTHRGCNREYLAGSFSYFLRSYSGRY